MFLRVHFKGSMNTERSHARRMRTHQSFHATMHHEKVVHHFLVGAAIHFARQADGFALKGFQMRQEVKSIFVVGVAEGSVTNATKHADGVLLLLMHCFCFDDALLLMTMMMRCFHFDDGPFRVICQIHYGLLKPHTLFCQRFLA